MPSCRPGYTLLYPTLFGAALIELVYWSGNYQTVTHRMELMAMGESPKPLLIEK